MKNLLAEFKKFAMRGNVLDMAVGVIVGGAFTSIVNSLVGDIFMPVIGIITGGVDFSALVFTLNGVNINIGNFINAIINFLLIAFSVFMFVKVINSHKKKEEEAKPAPVISNEEKLLTEIRDLLKESK